VIATPSLVLGLIAFWLLLLWARAKERGIVHRARWGTGLTLIASKYVPRGMAYLMDIEALKTPPPMFPELELMNRGREGGESNMNERWLIEHYRFVQMRSSGSNVAVIKNLTDNTDNTDNTDDSEEDE